MRIVGDEGRGTCSRFKDAAEMWTRRVSRTCAAHSICKHDEKNRRVDRLCVGQQDESVCYGLKWWVRMWCRKEGTGNRRRTVLQYQKRRFPKREPQRVQTLLLEVAKIKTNLLNECRRKIVDVNAVVKCECVEVKCWRIDDENGQDCRGLKQNNVKGVQYSDFVEFLPCKEPRTRDHGRRIAARQAARVDARRERREHQRQQGL